MYDRESGQVSTQNRWGSAFRPTLSPDGRWLVYGTRHIDQTRLRIRDLRSGEERWLMYPVQRDDQESRATLDVYPGMSFTPDSRYLVATWNGRFWKVPVEGSTAPTEIPFEADVVQAMGPPVRFDYRISDSASFVVKQIRDAVPSPDGKRLAFVALDRLPVDWPPGSPDGSPPRMWASTSRPGARWQWLRLHTLEQRSGGPPLPDPGRRGGRPQRLTNASAFWQPAGVLSDKGPVVRFAARRAPFRNRSAPAPAARAGPGLVPQPGVRRSSSRRRRAGDPPFSGIRPDLGLRRRRGAGLMRWDGTDVKTHLRVTGAGAPGGGGGGGGAATTVIVGPDATQALAQVGADLYVVTIPWVGGTEPTVSVGNPEGATFPVRRLTDIGGQFPSWGANGTTVHWSIGNAHVVYDLDRARAFDDSVRRAGPRRPAAGADSTARDSTAPRGRRPRTQFQPNEVTIGSPRRTREGVGGAARCGVIR